MKLLKKIKSMVCISAVITLVLGIVFLFRPIGALSTIARIVGTIVIISGLLDVIHSLTEKQNRELNIGTVVVGVVKCVFGVFIIMDAAQILSLFSTIFSILIIIFGVNGITHALQLKYGNISGWQGNLIVFAIVLAAGILLLFDPFGTISITARVMGVVLIVNAVNELITLYRLRKMQEQFSRTIRDVKDELDGNIIDVDEK